MSCSKPGRAINPFRLWTGAFIPNWLLSRPELTPNEKLLYARLCQYAGRNGYAYPSVSRLAADLAVSERTIFASIRKLREAGLVFVKDRRAEGRSSLYYFLDHDWMHDGPLPSEPGDAGEDDSGAGPAEVPLEPTGTDGGVTIAKSGKHLNGRPPEADFTSHLQARPVAENRNKSRKLTPSVGSGQTPPPPEADCIPHLKPASPRSSLRESVEEKQKTRARRGVSFQVLSIPDRVIALYDEVFVEVHGKHYVHTARDLEAARTLWERAGDLAQTEADEKGLQGRTEELRAEVLAFWLRKLAKREGFVASTGWCLWTVKTALTGLGSPFRTRKREARQQQTDRASSQDVAAMWSTTVAETGIE